MRSKRGKPQIIMDTGPLAKLFIKEDGWENVEKIVACLENGQIEGSISVVTLTEIYAIYYSQGRAEQGLLRVQELSRAPYLNKLEVDEVIAAKAGEFKGRYSIPTGDALIAASAYCEDLIVVSEDAHFRKIREIRAMTEKELLAHLK